MRRDLRLHPVHRLAHLGEDGPRVQAIVALVQDQRRDPGASDFFTDNIGDDHPARSFGGAKACFVQRGGCIGVNKTRRPGPTLATSRATGTTS